MEQNKRLEDGFTFRKALVKRYHTPFINVNITKEHIYVDFLRGEPWDDDNSKYATDFLFALTKYHVDCKIDKESRWSNTKTIILNADMNVNELIGLLRLEKPNV